MVYYFHGCMPIFSHAEDDSASFKMFTSQLYVDGNCKQSEIVRAFGVTPISVKRAVKKYRERGVAGFFRPRRLERKPRVWTDDVVKKAQTMLDEDASLSDIAQELNIKPDTLYRAVRSGKLVEKKNGSFQEGLNRSQRSVEDNQAAMGMACTRVVERACASAGQSACAPSVFEPLLDVSNAGVLWALPALLANGLLRRSEEFFSLPKGFYSLTQIFLLLAFMALNRIKSVERLRYAPPGEYGKLLGLDRIPEVRTLRAKLKILTQPEAVEQFSAELSRQWMQDDPQAAGTLYVDGHVRLYHGSQTKLPRRYVSRQRLCLRGTTDYWVNDQTGRPFFVVSTPFTAGLLATLRTEMVPRLLEDVPNQPTQEQFRNDPLLSRFTMVFDREGYSPVFFKEMWDEHRIACQTYNKYPKEDWPTSEFEEVEVAMPHGQRVAMQLAERGTLLAGGLWVKEVRKLSESGHQTSVLSTAYRLAASDVGAYMFSRWSQENFFKYMMEHYDINRLTEYGVEPVDETVQVVNPAYRTLESQIKSKAATLSRRQAAFGQMSLHEELRDKQVALYERKMGELREEIESLEEELADLKTRRKQTDRHIALGKLPEPDRFAKLAPTRKQFIDTIRMIAYRAETAMAIALRDVLARSDDARPLLREIFTSDADLIPNQEEKTLTVRLHHLTNSMSDQAARFLAQRLNEAEVEYPGTDLRLVYKLVSDSIPPDQEF